MTKKKHKKNRNGEICKSLHYVCAGAVEEEPAPAPTPTPTGPPNWIGGAAEEPSSVIRCAVWCAVCGVRSAVWMSDVDVDVDVDALAIGWSWRSWRCC